jgi:hypothetical protein
MKLLALSIVTLATASALAAGKSTTEYYYQPSAGVNAVEAKYLMDLRPGKTDDGTGEKDQKYEMSDFYLNYAYGLNDNNAFGAELFFGSQKITSDTTSHTANGMGDIHLLYKGFTDMWHYGADLGISTAKIKLDTATNLQDNRSSGGMSLKVNGGVLMNSGAINYGADLSYLMPFERQIDDANSTKLTGGNTLKLAPFVEYNWGMGFLGAELAYNMVDDLTIKSGAFETKMKGESYLSLMLNGSFDFTDSTVGLLSLGMGMHPEHDETSAGTTKVKAYTETIASLGVRMTF